MKQRYLLGAASAVLVLAPAIAAAQDWRWQEAEEGARQPAEDLVVELQELIEEAERRRAADPAFLAELRDLAERYTVPWTVTVIEDSFQDGDYDSDPSWTVAAGDFWVDRELGLRTAVGEGQRAQGGEQAEPGDPMAQILGQVLGQVLDQPGAFGQQGRDGVTAAGTAYAEIYLDRALPNAFAVEMRAVVLETTARGGLLAGPYQGGQRDTGYVLALWPEDGAARVEILRARGGRSSVIASEQADIAVGPDTATSVEWTRGLDGDMVVRLDGETVLEALDRGITGGFDGFRITNAGGNYAIPRVAVATVPEEVAEQ